MKKVAAALLLGCAVAAVAAAETPQGLPRSSPEAQGIPSSAILAFVEAANEKAVGLHSLMLVRHGHVVAEGWWRPYERDDPHMLFSLSKSFASTGIGLAVAEGKLSLDDTVVSFFPEDVPAEPSENLKAMRVRDLLAMSTGTTRTISRTFSFDGSPVPLVRAFLTLPVAHKPGTHFLYNTPASYMLSAIVQKATGQTLVEYLGPRLFEPLGIQNPKWDASPQGISLGGYGLNATTEDIARFGQLYLQRGAWQGRQLLPAEWVAAATSRQTSNGSNPKSDWDQGYGYQFWRCRHGFYRGDGAFGQEAVRRFEEPDRIPVVPAIAHRFLVPMTGTRFRDYYADPETMLRTQILAQKWLMENVRTDAYSITGPWVGAWTDFQNTFEAGSLGCEIAFPDDDIPWVGSGWVSTDADLGRLEAMDVVRVRPERAPGPLPQRDAGGRG